MTIGTEHFSSEELRDSPEQAASASEPKLRVLTFECLSPHLGAKAEKIVQNLEQNFNALLRQYDLNLVSLYNECCHACNILLSLNEFLKLTRMTRRKHFSVDTDELVRRALFVRSAIPKALPVRLPTSPTPQLNRISFDIFMSGVVSFSPTNS